VICRGAAVDVVDARHFSDRATNPAPKCRFDRSPGLSAPV
jgi:hypothetical protein